MQFGIAVNVSSEEHAEHKQERVQHGTHEHGKARLTMAKTETGVEVMLETPAANIFGFGHKL